MDYTKDLKVQIYDFYTNEILDEEITFDEAAEKYKVAPNTIRKSLNDGHCIRNKSKRFYFGVRYPHEPINERLEKRLNEFYKWNNFYTIYKRTSLKYKNRNSLEFWLSHDYKKIYVKKSINKSKKNHQRRNVNEWCEDILKIKHMIKIKIVVYIFRQVCEIKKNFGNSEQFVSKIRYINRIGTKIVRINPNTQEVIEIFENYNDAKDKYGKKVEKCMRPGRIYREMLNFCEDIHKNYNVGDKIDWIQIDENVKCNGGCGRIGGVEHSEQICRWCTDFKNDNIKSIISRKIKCLQDKKCTIDEDDIDKKLEHWDKRTCERCGVKLYLNKIGKLNSLSIDSTTPGEGHQKGKWLVTCHFCNYAKNDASEEEIDLLIKMLKTNKIDFTTLSLLNLYRHMYVSEIFENYKMQSKELIKEIIKNLNFRSEILGFPFIPFKTNKKDNKKRKSCCIFSPSLDRIDNNDTSHEYNNVNVVPVWFNLGRRDIPLEEFVKYIKTTFPSYNPDTLEVIFPHNIDCKKWVENTMNTQQKIENHRDATRKFYNTDENVKNLVNIPKDDLYKNKIFINLKRRIYKKSATELDRQIFFEELKIKL